MDKQKTSPNVGMQQPREDAIERMLKQAEKGELGGTLRRSRPEGERIIRPFSPPPYGKTPPPSKAPRGMANAVEGDLGHYRQVEAKKVFPGLAGKDQSNPLRYRKPATAIDEKFGPGDKVC